MQRVGFIVKPNMSNVSELLDPLVSWLVDSGCQAFVVAEDGVNPDGATIVRESSLKNHCQLLVVLGGDGTMLRAADLVAEAGIPVLGINLGRLGFLTPFDPHSALDAMRAAVAGKLGTSARMRLKVTFHQAQGKSVTRIAANEAVIHQGAMARLIELDARVGDSLIAEYRVDGLIICSPTGSTAYNLAAGGPILAPGLEAMVLTPICAHSLTHRPLVLPKNATVRVALDGQSHGVALTVDGQWARSFKPGDRLEITCADNPLIIYESETTYFDILRAKLHWGVRSDHT